MKTPITLLLLPLITLIIPATHVSPAPHIPTPHPQTTHSPGHPQTTKATQLASIYTAEIGIREATGNNDGSRVEEYLHYVKLKRGDPWCAAFVCWALGKAGLPNPRSGYCPALFPRSRIVWQRSRHAATKTPQNTPARGDVFGIWFASKGRIAHAGFVEEWGSTYVITVEGNTNESGSREGDGVYKKRRLQTSLYQVARYADQNTPNT